MMRPLAAGDCAGVVDEETFPFSPRVLKGPVGLDSFGPGPSIYSHNEDPLTN